jgi:hypothetical protein
VGFKEVQQKDVSGGGYGQPATDAFVVAFDQDFPAPTRALFVGGAGVVVVVMYNGAQVAFQGVVAGTLLPIRATRVVSAGTTAGLAGQIIGLY